MKRIITIGLILVLALSTMQGTAQAAKSYSNCTKLTRDYAHGVAKTRKAARRAVRQGYGRPKVSRRLYLANDHLDADNDRVACER